MKINRSSKCYFNKWLTQKKKDELKEVLLEYSRVVNYFIVTYEKDTPSNTKFDLCKAGYIQECIATLDTFLTARLIKNAFQEGYGMVQSAKSNAENRKDKKYSRPVHYGKKITLSETCAEHGIALTTKLFDFSLILKCLRTDKGRGYKIQMPLKRHAQFNKWNNLGKLAKSVTITDKYVMFNFEIETGTKKEEGSLVGFDFGMKKLGTLSNGNIVGNDIENHLRELQCKKHCSKGYYRKKEEIKEYINREIKGIDFSNKQLVVVEKLKNMKYKMKERGRLSKNIRSVFYNLSYRQVLSRIQMLCEENRVSFRSVLPYYTSQECSSCGHVEKGNRLSQESFVCLKCGFSDNADLNASKVILKRFTMGTYGSHYKQAYLDETTKVSISL
jgi:IS605 OrfB family transposase